MLSAPANCTMTDHVHMNQLVPRLQAPFRFLALIGALLIASVSGPGVPLFPASASEIPAPLREVGVTEHLGEEVAVRNLAFRDEAGHSVRLADYFGEGKPVLLALVYYDCPNLCNLVL